jgi:hypothetical protein
MFFIDTQSWTVVAKCAGRYEAEGRRIQRRSTVNLGHIGMWGTVSIIDAASRKIIHIIGFEIAEMTSELITLLGLRFASYGRTAFIPLGPCQSRRRD